MSRPPRRGFTLTELLIVIAIAAVSIGMLLPAVRRVREPAERSRCQNNFKEIILAMHNFEATGTTAPSRSPGDQGSVTERFFPPGCSGPGTLPEDRLSWMVALLPYLGEDSTYRQFDLTQGYGGNLPASRTGVRTFLCPSWTNESAGEAVTHYVAMSGIGSDAAARPVGVVGNGFMGYDRLTSLAMITDGASNTVALMETRSGLGPWARGGPTTLRGFDPADLPLNGDGRPFYGHSSGMLAAMVDGSVHSIGLWIEPTHLAAAITIAGGEPMNLY